MREGDEVLNYDKEPWEAAHQNLHNQNYLTQLIEKYFRLRRGKGDAGTHQLSFFDSDQKQASEAESRRNPAKKECFCA